MSYAREYEIETRTSPMAMKTTAMDSSRRGTYHIRVCTNVSCMLRGGDELMDRICKHYDIGNQQRTPDGHVSVEEIACMGACENAPIVSLNDEFFEEVSVNDLPQLYNMIRK